MNDLTRVELRQGWLGVPRPYQPFDAIGVAMGAYFIWDAVDTPRDTAWINIALGAVMIYIHSQRFLFAPQDKGGLNRLLNSVGVRREDICQ